MHPRALILLGVAALANGAQRPFGLDVSVPDVQNAGAVSIDAYSRYDAGLFTPFRDLDALSREDFTRLQHPAFPHHSVRVKQSHFCDGTVKAYTGYIDVEARHLFFYLFESRRDPAADDVVFWTNGGPAGSSAWGLFMELGPCRVTGPNSAEPWKYSWNERANIFFIEQPVGVGFSYAEFGETAHSTHEGAKDVAAFAAIFFEHFTQFKGKPFHMAGESYAGRYLPVYASELLDQNTRFRERGLPTVNLTSVMIGNGITDWFTMFPSFYDVQCTTTEYGPPLDTIANCVQMKQKVPRCEKRLQESCIDVYDEINCRATFLWCTESLAFQFVDGPINPYDRTRPCKGHPEAETCYPLTRTIEQYLSQPHIQHALGVDPAKRGNYTTVAMDVHQAFIDNGDFYNFRAQHHIAGLLERGVKVLLYVGGNDLVCNPIGIERLTLELEWSGREAYNAAPLRSWEVDGEAAGRTRSSGGLTFATIYGGGHVAPYDQPERAFALANRWLAGEEL